MNIDCYLSIKDNKNLLRYHVANDCLIWWYLNLWMTLIDISIESIDSST